MVANNLTIQKCVEGKLHIFNINETDAYCNEAGKHLSILIPSINTKKFSEEYANNPYLCQKCKKSMLHQIKELMIGV